MTLDLPATGLEQPPLFVTLEQCHLWRKTLPMANPVQAQAQLLRQLALLDRYTLDGATRLAMLEELRETVYTVQAETAKKFTGRPLPLAPPEQAACDSNASLWQLFIAGYLRCIDACLAGDEAAGLHAGTACARALAALSQALLELLHAGRHAPDDHWRLANTLYASAEALSRTTTAADDPLRPGKPLSPAAAYAEMMLLAAASLHELTPRQQAWVMGWARRWAGKVTILTAPPNDPAALPLCVDLDSATPASFRPRSGKGTRWLDTGELRKSLKKRLTLLDRGETNLAKLGLGEDCVLPAAGNLLRRIYPHWVKGGVVRRHERHPMSGPCRFTVGVGAVHYYIGGHQPFKSPVEPTHSDLGRLRDRMAIFDSLQMRPDDEYSRNHGYQLENWEVIEDWNMLDESTGGLRITRPLKQAGGRIALGQLIALQPGDVSNLLLGVVRWAQVSGDRLLSGIQLFPGRPMAIGLRPTGVMAEREPWLPGFYLPALASLETPETLVAPPGSYKPNRIMAVWQDEGAGEVRLKELLDRGADFERIACSSITR